MVCELALFAPYVHLPQEEILTSRSRLSSVFSNVPSPDTAQRLGSLATSGLSVFIGPEKEFCRALIGMLSITVNTYANISHHTSAVMPRDHGECTNAGVIYDRYQVVAELSSAGAKSLGDRDYEAARDIFREGIEVVREIEDMGVPPPTGRVGAERGKKSTRRHSYSSFSSRAAGDYGPRNRQEDSLHSSASSISLSDEEARGSGGKNNEPCRDDAEKKKVEAEELDQDPPPSSKPESGDCAEDGGGIAVQRRPVSVDFVKSPELLDDLCFCGSLLPQTVSSALIFNLALAHHLHAMDTGSPTSVRQSLALYQLAMDSLGTSEYISIRQFKPINCIENLMECRHRLIRAVLGNMFIIYCDCEEFEYAGKIYEELGMISAVMNLHGLHDGGFGVPRNPPT